MLLDQLAGEALRELLHAVQGTLFCRSTAERLQFCFAFIELSDEGITYLPSHMPFSV